MGSSPLYQMLRLIRPFDRLCRRIVDSYKCTYSLDWLPEFGIRTILTPSALETNLDTCSLRFSVCSHYLKHRFDLLGSGWVRVYHGMQCRGLDGYRYNMGEPVKVDLDGQWLEERISTSNLAEAQRIWRMVDQDYTPIDWHIDFKSGYRWLEKTWYRDIKVGHKPGVDVKVPWELARMQHMPQLAFVFQSLPDPSEERILLQRAFRNQVLDFIASNPPRFGINWYYPMDVAIRSANWLMAYDLFRAGKARFDDKFESVFTRSIYEHGHHILGNLEWNDKIRGNHYLADITGLAFIASYLPSTAQTDAWLAFSVQELIAEVEHQFYPDGGNFEGSTAYHRLSAEMVYFATALVLGLPQERLKRLQQCDYPKWFKTGWGKPGLKPGPIPFYKLPKVSKAATEESPFPAWYFERLERMAEFIVDITKPDGRIPQIGDNDSGRWFKLAPRYERMTVREARTRFGNLEGYAELPDDAEYLMESHLDCSHLVAAAYGLFSWDDFGDRLGGEEETENMPDTICIKALTGGVRIGSQRLSTCKKQEKSSFPIKGVKI